MMNTSGLDDELLVGFLLKMRIANILRSSKHLLFFKKNKINNILPLVSLYTTIRVWFPKFEIIHEF